LVLNNHRELSGWSGSGTTEQGYLLGLLLGEEMLKQEVAEMETNPSQPPLDRGGAEPNPFMRLWLLRLR
jgi:hypothetical protein